MPFEFTRQPIAGVVTIRPRVFADARGCFFEAYKASEFRAAGIEAPFVQDNDSVSTRGVLRGLHYQLPPLPQAKLVRVTRGAVFDIAVDIRRSSPTFGQWRGYELSAENHRQLWIPEGFAHGFLALGDGGEVQYKTTAPYFPDLDRAIRWDDPEIGIEWPLGGEEPLVSEKDASAPSLGRAEVFE